MSARKRAWLKIMDFQPRSLTGASYGNQTMDTAFSIGVMSVMGYVIIAVD